MQVTQQYVIVAEGEGAVCKVVSNLNLHQELHNTVCACGKPWKQCTTQGNVVDVAGVDVADNWATDERGKPFSYGERHETGRVTVYRVTE